MADLRTVRAERGDVERLVPLFDAYLRANYTPVEEVDGVVLYARRGAGT